ncbi:MAG: thiamine pyrophosphate-dependent enzyme [Candidatus Kapabacteria bacterium]|nr:thiamine pyrophosphate-dependent enzyme [Candidatus Kapabacteria bacterium]
MTTAKIIAETLYNLDYRVITYVPGYGANQTFELLNEKFANQLTISYHEEIASAVAAGAAITGTRAAVIIKTHGLLKSMNCIIDVMTSGVNASLLFIIFDDKTGTHSDNIFDIVPIVRGANLPTVVSTPANIQHSLIDSTNKSENSELPCVIVVDAADIESDGAYSEMKHKQCTKPYSRNIYKNLVTPILADYQYQVLQRRIASQPHDDIPKPTLPQMSQLPPEWQRVTEDYIPFFEIFKTIKRDVTVGDTSLPTLFALEPYSCIDITLHMGGSIPTAIGAYLAGYSKAWAVLGDFAFLSCGIIGLQEAINREIPLKIVLFDNGIAGATGGQPVNTALLESLLMPYKDRTTKISLSETRADELNIILFVMAESKKLEILHIKV